MTFGFQLYNNAGSILIDGESYNYSLLASGTLAVGSSGTAVSFATQEVPPLVFVRLSSQITKFVRIMSKSTSSVQFGVYDRTGTNNTFANLSTGTIDYMIFGLAKSLSPSSGYGLHVFNSTGDLVFDSNKLSPRVKQVVVIPGMSTPTTTFRQPTSNVSHSSGSNPWMLINCTLSPYGYVFMQDPPGTLSQLLFPALCSRPDGTIWMCAVNGATIGTQGSQWTSAPVVVPLIQ